MGRFPDGFGVLMAFGVLLCALLVGLFTLPASPDHSLTGLAAHGTYNAFSAPEPGLQLAPHAGPPLIMVSDTVVYKNGWYSVNGSAWQPLTLLGGQPYGSSNSLWLSASANFSLPNSLLNVGEHYIIVYTCTRVANSWDCHDGKWQLRVFAPYAKAYLDKGSDCGDVLDYQCGSRTICGSVADFGDCQTGYDCADNLCIARDDLTCDGVTCGDDEYCARGVCLLSVPGKTYFVAPWGNNSWQGNFTHPFATWQQGANVALSGDIVYIRGGVWQPRERPSGSRGVGMAMQASGTAQAPIRYFNYPGEKPILDQEFIAPDIYRWNSGISGQGVEYIHLQGLTVRHIHTVPPNFSHAKPYSEVSGIGCSPCANMHYENLVSHDIDGRGFQHWTGAWNDFDAQYGVDRCLEEQASLPGGGNPAACTYDTPYYESDNSTWINCDAYNLFDRYSNRPGNAADGWKVGTYYNNHMTWIGCRAWNYSDDGFDPHGSGFRAFEGCWAMSSDKYDNLTELWGIEGNGFKLTGMSSYIPGYTIGGVYTVRVENSIAAFGGGAGIINNLLVNYDDQMPNNGHIRNNFGYKTAGNFWDGGGNVDGTRSTIFTNNIAYKSTYDGYGQSPIYEVGIYNPAIYPHSNNSWRAKAGESWPGWEYNPAYNVTDEDFVSLDYRQLARPRKADGSLPDITFGHLAPGSDLIDGGAVIPGYHCATVGAHPGEECREWYGAAPDLGPFEYQG